MASSLYDSLNTSKQAPQANMFSQLAQFRKMLNGRDPKQIVESMLQNGQMTKEQFEQYSSIANQLVNSGGYGK